MRKQEIENKVTEIIKNDPVAWMYEKELAECPQIGQSVAMGNITATVIDKNWVSSHGCWTLTFDANGKEQSISIHKVLDFIKSGKMTIAQ